MMVLLPSPADGICYSLLCGCFQLSFSQKKRVSPTSGNFDYSFAAFRFTSIGYPFVRRMTATGNLNLRKLDTWTLTKVISHFTSSETLITKSMAPPQERSQNAGNHALMISINSMALISSLMRLEENSWLTLC